jgi:hypothetical protein
MMTDPIADMLTRIRNAVRVEHTTVELPLSKVKKGWPRCSSAKAIFGTSRRSATSRNGTSGCT